MKMLGIGAHVNNQRQLHYDIPVPRAGNETDDNPSWSASSRHLSIPPFHTFFVLILLTSRWMTCLTDREPAVVTAIPFRPIEPFKVLYFVFVWQRYNI